jgi:CRISPR-associated protein Csb2
MLAIKFAFTAGRYHATQWGRQVNEGVPEWPPSPWRILRGIVATWRRTLPGWPEARVVPILEALASEFPRFHLPAASTGHTRHFMPYIEGSRERTALVIDSFVAIRTDAPVFAVWPKIELAQAQEEDLSAILQNMPYLGRAESWVEASLASEYPEINCYALESGSLPQGDLEITRTLTPRSPIKLKDLEVESSSLRRAGRIDPEGGQWWPYIRKADCFKAYRSVGRQRHWRGEGATVARFAMAGRPLPMAADTLRWGELARKSAMAMYGRQNDGSRSEKLSGKDEEGKPLKGHRHAFYVPTDMDGDGRLEHLTIWTPGRLSEKDFRAIVSVDALQPRGRPEAVQLVYQSHGSEEEYRGVSPLFGRSRHWRSLTPYVLTRHVKFRGPKGAKRMVDGPEDQIRREVALRFPDGPKLAEVRVLHPHCSIKPIERGRSGGLRPFEFFRHKRGGSNGGGAFNVKLEFEEEIGGPLLLGFACHYGLGIFVPG